MPGVEIAAALVDVAIGVGAMVTHLFISVLWASGRPWRYVYSNDYRLTFEQ